MRRITQQTLIDILAAAESIRRTHLHICHIVTGLAESLPRSTTADAILQLVSNAEFDIHKETLLFATEQARVDSTQARNNYLRRRREAKAISYEPMTDDDLDAPLPEGLPSPDLVEE